MMAKAAAAASAAAQPVLWTLLGYQFEAASMIAGLCACLMVRIWVSLNDRSSKLWAWGVDLTVTAISMLFTAGWIVLQRPAPFYALLSGTGFGALGAGVIALAFVWIRRIGPMAGLDAAAANDGPIPPSSVARDRSSASEGPLR